jgi:hypothetical protein
MKYNFIENIECEVQKMQVQKIREKILMESYRNLRL